MCLLSYCLDIAHATLLAFLEQALRTVIERYELPVRITANQSLILTEIDPSWKADILNTLQGAGVRCAAVRVRLLPWKCCHSYTPCLPAAGSNIVIQLASHGTV